LNVLSSQNISSFFVKFLVELVLETIEHFHIFLVMCILAHCFICALYAWSKFPLLILSCHPFHDVDRYFWNCHKVWFEIKLLLGKRVTILLLRKCLVGNVNIDFWFDIKGLNVLFDCEFDHCFEGESILWWPKNVVTSTVFQNYATFNFHQAHIRRSFHKLYQNKVVQLPKMQLSKETTFFY